MKNILTIILCIILLSTSFTMSFATSNDQKEVKRNQERIEFEKVVKTNKIVKENLSSQEIEFFRQIIIAKQKNPLLSVLEVQILYKIVMIPSTTIQTRASNESGAAWPFTLSETALMIQHPIAALQVNGCKNLTDQWTSAYYPNWNDGDRGNAYRHAMWNGLMTKEIGFSLAEKFATAHEDVPSADLQSSWMGFYGWQHKSMDLFNNNKGRLIYSTGDGAFELHQKLTYAIAHLQLSWLIW